MTATARKINRTAETTARGESSTQSDLLALQAAMWAFTAKISADQGERDDLHDGQHSNVRIAIVAEVDGHRTRHSFAGSVNVGHASTRASSVGPNQDELLALVLSKLNTATRDAICRDLADDFAAAGKMPEVDSAIVKQAAKLRADLRQKVDQQVRGSVRVNFTEANEPELSIVSREN